MMDNVLVSEESVSSGLSEDDDEYVLNGLLMDEVGGTFGKCWKEASDSFHKGVPCGVGVL